jgi:hypothetical protein
MLGIAFAGTGAAPGAKAIIAPSAPANPSCFKNAMYLSFRTQSFAD